VLGSNFLETLKTHDNQPSPDLSLSHLCHEPHRPFIQSDLGKRCSDAFVYHQELLPFYHVTHDFLCIKSINCLAISLTTCKKCSITFLCITTTEENSNHVVGRCENATGLKRSADESLSLLSATEEVSLIYLKDGISLH